MGKIMKLTKDITLLVFVLASTSLYAENRWSTGVYENNTAITKILSLPDSNRIRISIEGELEADYDFLTIRDSEGHEWPFTGMIDYSFEVQGSSVELYLESDYSITKSGVEVRVTDASVEEADSSYIPTLSDKKIRRFLSVINNARSEGRYCGYYGYYPAADDVTWNDKLYYAAYEHSYDISENDLTGHEGSGSSDDISGYILGKESDMADRVKHYGYQYSRLNENVATGTSYKNARQVVNSWLESPTHCKNLMNPYVREVGMAKVKNRNGIYTNYWTQNFAR